MLTLRDVSKRYGNIQAVADLSLSLQAGEVLGLLGPNGAGKSTTVSICTGLVRPDSGTVTIGTDASPADPAGRRMLGLAPQSLAVYEELTGRENVAFFGRLYGLSGRDLARRCERVLDAVGLLPRAGDRVRTWSGGMKRRLNIAVALVHDPPVLLLDEPTAGVDPQSRAAILDLVRNLRDQGRAVLYTTHYMEELHKVGDRVAIIDHGRLLDCDTVDNLIDRHGGPSEVHAVVEGAERRTRTDNPSAAVADILAQGRVSALAIRRPDLETVFLNLTGRHLRDDP